MTKGKIQQEEIIICTSDAETPNFIKQTRYEREDRL
jgi:hypothetical protein